MAKSVPLYITRIIVRKLFGIFDYDLDQAVSGDQPGRIMILYGDNGSGKTTILRMIFHLLAPEHEAGHKSAIARIPFSLFEITFNNKTEIRVERPTNKLIGSFTIIIKQERKKAEYFNFYAVEDLTIPPLSVQPKAEREKLIKCYSLLRSFNIALYHLADDRTLELGGRVGLKPSAEDFNLEDLIEKDIYISQRSAFRELESYRIRRPEELSKALLDNSIERFITWIKNQALQASASGESSVHILYNEILRQLSQLPAETSLIALDKFALKNRIKKIEALSKSLAMYGLLPEFSGKEILNQIELAREPQKINIMERVVTPYLGSLERRIEALMGLYNVLDNLINIVNQMLSHKKMRFNIQQGLTITMDNGDLLNTDNLSSGERHLLLIFCNTIIALDRPSIFIIDEPEISLNIKWQRSLISSLCRIIGDKPIQYIFATHSLEIISQYRDRILKLETI